MKLPKTIWNYSLETEADRLIQTTSQTANRFYPKYGFFVLPYLVPGSGKTVLLPDLKFPRSFFDKVKNLQPDIPMPADEASRKLALEKLKVSGLQLQAEKAKKISAAWQKKEKKFWEYLLEIFPQLEGKIKSVEIRPTSFGSLCSFSLDLPIRISVRLDMNEGQIAEGIVSSLFTQKIEAQGYNWEEREAALDFILKSTKLAPLFPNYKATLVELKKNQVGKLAQDSQKYLKKLGISTGEIFRLKNRQLLIDGKTAKLDLTPTEKEVILLLIARKNQFCSLDDLAEVIWGEQSFDKFSPWAIAKLVSRLRQKISQYGVSPEIIQTKRGEGYLLKD